MAPTINGVLVVHKTRIPNVTIHAPVRDTDPMTGATMVTGMVRLTEDDDLGHLVIEDRNPETNKSEWRFFV